MVTQIVLTSTRSILTLPDQSLLLAPATITISPSTGYISSIVPAVLPPSSFPAGTTYINHSPHILLPGLVDAHVHLNEPGRTAWEGFETGTRAAAAGGVTTVVDMPLNSVPPTTTVQGLKAKTNAAKGKCWVDVAFYGGIVPGNAGELEALVDAGVRGFKGFLIDSGVDEFPAVSTKDVEETMKVLKDIPTTLMFHAEMEPSDSPTESPSSLPSSSRPVESTPPDLTPGAPTSYDTFLTSRPPTFETRAISSILSLAPLAPKLHLHIVHLSATEAIPLLRDARARGVKITAETCFHYLELQAEDIPDGDTRHKCCPPIRSGENRDALWKELARADSCIRTVVSDHSPCTPELKILPRRLCGGGGVGSGGGGGGVEGGGKGVAGISSAATDSAESLADSGIDVSSRTSSPPHPKPSPSTTTTLEMEAEATNAGDFMAAWGGISSVGLGLPILHTAASSRGLRLHDIVRLCSQETARQVGLSHRKGGLKVGLDADICVFDDSAEWTLTRDEMRWRNKCSPWEGRRFRGRVKETWVRGRKVWDGEGVVGAPGGQLILERRTV